MAMDRPRVSVLLRSGRDALWLSLAMVAALLFFRGLKFGFPWLLAHFYDWRFIGTFVFLWFTGTIAIGSPRGMFSRPRE